MRATSRFFTIILASWLFLTGCTVSIATTVNPNGSGEVKMIYKLSQDDQNTLTQSGMADASKLCEGLSTMSEGFSGQGSIRQEKHGSETWCVMSQVYGSLEEMRTILSQQGLSVNTLSIANGRFIFDASMNTGDSSSDLNVGFPVGLTYELILPGKAITHNADKVMNYTLIWESGLGQVKSMHAESGVEGRSTDWLGMIQKPLVILPCIGIFMLVLIALIIAELTRGSRQAKPPIQPPGGPVVSNS